jgi:hypothetical protein
VRGETQADWNPSHLNEEDDRIQSAADTVMMQYPEGFNPFSPDQSLAAMDALRDAGIQDAYTRDDLPRRIFSAIADKKALLRGELI